MRRIVSLVVFVACLIFMGSVVSAKVWLLPDYENNDLFKSRNNTKTRPSDPGRECTGYGWKSLASFPSDLECLEEYNGHIKCCKKWRCDTDIYTYNSDTCSGDIEGNKCYNDDGTEYGTECHILCDREKFPYPTNDCTGNKEPGGNTCTDVINGVNSTKHYSECNCITTKYPYTSCPNNSKPSEASEDNCEDSVKHYSKCVCDTTIYKYPTQSCSGGNLHGDTCKGSDNVTHYEKCTVCGDCQNWDSSIEECYIKSCPTGSASDVSQCPNNDSVSTPNYCKYEIGDKDICGCAPCNATCADGYMAESTCANQASGNRTAIFTQAGTCGSISCGTCSVDCRDPYHDDSTECGTDTTRCVYDITGEDGCGECSYACNNENGYYSSTSGCTGTLQANAEWVLKNTGNCGSTITCGTCAQQCKTNFVDTFSYWCAKPATHNCAMLGYSTSVTSCETGTLIKCPFDTSYGVCVGGGAETSGDGNNCDATYSLDSCPYSEGAESCSECGGKYRIDCCKSGYTWSSHHSCCNTNNNRYHTCPFGWYCTAEADCYIIEHCASGFIDCYGDCVQCQDENCNSYSCEYDTRYPWKTEIIQCALW